mgnify:CR=1 FL=1
MARKINYDSLPATKADIKRLDRRFSGVDGKFNKVMNHLTGLAKMIKDLYDEFSAFNLEHRRVKNKLDDYEERTSGLERQIVS